MKIFMYFILAYGIFEIVSNIFHLSKGSVEKIGQSAKRQHQELPLYINDIHFFVKAIIMFAFGILFITVWLFYILNIDPEIHFGLIIFILHGGYGLIQAIIYRKYFNVWPAAVVYNIPLILFFVL
jgi:hypothetical protein